MFLLFLASFFLTGTASMLLVLPREPREGASLLPSLSWEKQSSRKHFRILFLIFWRGMERKMRQTTPGKLGGAMPSHELPLNVVLHE